MIWRWFVLNQYQQKFFISMPCIAQVSQLPQLSSKKKKSCHWDIVQDRMNWCWRWICDRQSGGNQESPIELQNNICWVSLWSWPHQKGISNGGIKDKSSVGWDRGTAIGIDGGGIRPNSRGQVEPLLFIAIVWNTYYYSAFILFQADSEN